MIGNLLNKITANIVGSSLTKNYELEKEPYLHGGLHNLWKVYRGKKKDRNNMDVSVFIFEKKSLEKKKLSQTQKDEIVALLKKEAQNLTKLRHPNLLSLIEQPMEDQKYIIVVTEPVEYNLSSLQFDSSKKEMIPGDLEIKCLSLELLEGLNFLHNNAKMIHMGLAPEHVYITSEGRLKIGGLNFSLQFSTSESLNVPLNYDLRIDEYAMVPNLRFAAPELSERQQVSIQSDIFSVASLLYYLVALNKNKSPNLLNQPDITDKQSHLHECGALPRKLGQLLQGFEPEFDSMIRAMLNQNPQLRGQMNEIVHSQWFQDPLLKTIKYLEVLDSKDHQNKVQFLQGISRILEKFDKKALLKKVMPLLLDQMTKVIQLSVNVLPSILEVMERQNFLTTTEFRETIWPSVQKLCKAKELPAQSLFLILKNTELFMKFVGPQEFQQNFLILVNKSLECGVPKLQFLALTKVPSIIKQIDYNTVKQSILPRILMILEQNSQIQIKRKTLEIITEIIGSIDQQTMKDKILKTFEKLRNTETDPQVCMLLLKIYEQMARVLGVEEIGLKILPGIIPMLISGSFTRPQFSDMMATVRRLLDQIEKHREKDLREMGQDGASGSDGFDLDALEKSLGINKTAVPSSSTPNVTNKDVFDFLSSLEGSGGGGSASYQTPSAPQNDIISTMNQLSTPAKAPMSIGGGQMMAGDPFASFGKPSTAATTSSGWDADFPSIASSANKKEEDFFASLSQQPPQKPVQAQLQPSWNAFGAPQTQPQQQQSPLTGLNFGGPAPKGGNLSKMSEDPFAELTEDKATTVGGSGPMNLNFGGQSKYPTPQQQPQQFGSGGFGMPQQQQQPQYGGGNQSFGSGNFQQPAFGQPFQQQQQSFGTAFGAPQQPQSNPFGSNPFQAPAFGTQVNKPATQQQAAPADDFFAQFTNPQQQQQKQMNNFNGLF